MNYDLRGDTAQVTAQDTAQDSLSVARTAQLLDFCAEPRTRDEMQQFMGIAHREYFRKDILKPLLLSSELAMTMPDKPNSKKQRYVRASNM